MQYYVYIVSNKKYGTLYIGVTNNLVRRINEHREHELEGFTDKCYLHKLVYYEVTENVESAISREKRLKNWKRQWKVELIDKFNPEWRDLYQEIL